jgi:DNA-directed RNA polymerase beta' subunit
MLIRDKENIINEKIKFIRSIFKENKETFERASFEKIVDRLIQISVSQQVDNSNLDLRSATSQSIFVNNRFYQGRIKSNLLGRRVNFAPLRSFITGDPESI